jgi:hypothetical protein
MRKWMYRSTYNNNNIFAVVIAGSYYSSGDLRFSRGWL